jgi:urease accessory protein
MQLPLMRLMQVISQSSPTGAFSYSQGLEWAVEAGWIQDGHTFENWVCEQLQGALTRQDLPLLQRVYEACLAGDRALMESWTATLLSLRETSELRAEERQRGHAMARLTTQLNSAVSAERDTCQLTVFAEYCAVENIPVDQAMQGYTFSWLESQIMAGVKLIPLGQTEGQQILYRLSEMIETCVQMAKTVDDVDIGYASPAVAFASSRHETQYSRSYRS